MSNDSDGGKAVPRVRIPLGSPSQTSTETAPSSARTELRSVSNDENRRLPRIGEEVEILDGDAIGLRRVTEHGTGEDGLTGGLPCFWIEATPWAYFLRNEGSTWRRLEQAAVDPGNPILEAADQFNRGESTHAVLPTAPEVQHCTAIVEGSGLNSELCGALIGRDVRCGICEATRCYQHCASLDHFGGLLVSRGGSGDLEWKLVEISAGRFAGQIARGAELLAVVGLATRMPMAEVLAQLMDRIRELEAAAAPPPLPLARINQTFVGLGEALEFVCKLPHGKPLARDKRAELAEEVIAWLRSCETAWERLAYDLPETADRAKELHDRQVVELFSRLAGAL